MEVAKLLDSARGSEVIDRTVRHLLARCRACRRGCDALRRLSREAHHPDYVIVLTEAREAPTLWRQLAALPYPSQLAAVEADESYQRWGLCRLLQRLSGEAACQDPESAGRLANLAVRIPPFLEPAYHVDSIRDLHALSFCYLGNAWRALRELHGAADAFDAARALLLAGTGDPAIAAEALALEARLLRDRRELAQAAALLDRVEAIYGAAGALGEGAEGAVRDDGDSERAAKARLHRAWCLYHLGRVDEARDLLERTAGQLDARRQPRLALAVRSGLAWCALSLGAPDTEARLAAAIQLAGQVGDDADRLRLRRAEARADLATGERGLAEQALRAAAAGFIERDLGVDAALSFLDLAALYLREGAQQSIFQQLSADLLPVFFYSEVGRQAMAFLLWFQQACETGKLTPGIIASVAQAVEGQRQPSLAWWSAPEIPPKEGTGDAGALG
jgi:tetratricopeptide (TPR) repeat protein